MSESPAPRRLCLVGSTGLIGSTLIERAIPRSDVRIVGVARREVRLPSGARMEMLLADPDAWPDAIAASNAQVLVCALGTTWRKSGRSEAAFRAVDYELVLACARAAKAEGIEHFILVSSVGADPAARNFYLRVKGEIELALAKIGFRRLDILRPGLLRGIRGSDRRPGERLAILLGPLADLCLHGRRRKFRSIRASAVADAIFGLAKQQAGGRFAHEFDGLVYAGRRTGD